MYLISLQGTGQSHLVGSKCTKGDKYKIVLAFNGKERAFLKDLNGSVAVYFQLYRVLDGEMAGGPQRSNAARLCNIYYQIEAGVKAMLHGAIFLQLVSQETL